MSTQDKRDELRARIEAAEERNAERTLADYARDARDTATAFVKEHPIATVAGVAAVGLAIGAMTRPGRRAGRQAARRTSALATYATELGLAYAAGLFENAGQIAQTGRDKFEDLGDAAGDTARNLRREAAHRAGDTADAARRLTREIGKKAGRKTRSLRSRITH